MAEVVAQSAAVVDPENIDAIALQLKRVATDGPFRGQLVAAGYQNARRFNWQANARALLETDAAAAGRRARS